jgi:hypothetical protein
MTAVWMVARILALVLAADEGATEQEEEGQSFEASPQAARNLIRLKPSYTHVDAGGDESRVLLRANLAYQSLIIPGLPVPKEYQSLFRVDVRAQAKHTKDANAAGLEDTQVLSLGGRTFSWIAVGGGFGMVLPTATDDALGKGKLQLAPAVAAMFLGLRGARLGFLAQNFFDVAGDSSRSSVNRLTLQPLLSYRLTPKLFVSSDPVFEFDWHSGTNTIPVNFQFGYEFGPNLSLALGPEWVTTGDGQNDVTINLTIDFEHW